ncbi:MAG: hypothetical protein Kow0068_06090 [Marinilabiliales bacterium]
MVDLIDDSLHVRDLDGYISTCKSMRFVCTGKHGYFKIKPVEPDYRPREYDDDLLIYPYNGKIRLINHVYLENYIAGVVESEGGSTAPLEYYKTQAIITRTYTLKHLGKHKDENFDLCDEVHCQAYHGRCNRVLDILEATFDTKGLVIIDTTLSLITATYHSNCGGQTCSSEDVWLTPQSYLKSVIDTFCLSGFNAKWTYTIPLQDWENYLKRYGFNLSIGTYNINDYSFKQNERKTYYTFNGDSIPLKTMRSDWKLKSTFFDVIQKGDIIELQGRGYGHGVGLCQEGAMEMARRGYDYQKIINYYYKNIYIVSLKALDFFKSND